MIKILVGRLWHGLKHTLFVMPGSITHTVKFGSIISNCFGPACWSRTFAISMYLGD